MREPMKASELIEWLQELIKEYGDLEVRVFDPAVLDMEPVTHAEVYTRGVRDHYIGLDAA